MLVTSDLFESVDAGGRVEIDAFDTIFLNYICN